MSQNGYGLFCLCVVVMLVLFLFAATCCMLFCFVSCYGVIMFNVLVRMFEYYDTRTIENMYRTLYVYCFRLMFHECLYTSKKELEIIHALCVFVFDMFFLHVTYNVL